MHLIPSALPESIIGFANLTMLMFFLAAGAFVAATMRAPGGMGAFGGAVGWVFFLMAPDQVRVANLVLLSIAMGIVSAAVSGAGYGRAAARTGNPVFWILAIVSVVLSGLVCVASSVLPVVAGALVCHLVGIALASQGIVEGLERTGTGGGGAAAVCAVLVAVFADGYLPQAWPIWPYLHAGIAAVVFLGTYASGEDLW